MSSERRTITVAYPTGRTYEWNGWGKISLSVDGGRPTRSKIVNQRTLGGPAGALAVIEKWEARRKRGLNDY